MSLTTEWTIELPKRDRAFRIRGLAGSIAGILGAILVFLSEPMITHPWISLAMDAIGWIVFLVGTGLRLWSTLYIGGRKEWTLVSEGPYSLCRNPLYVGSLLVGLSFGLLVKSLTFMAVISATSIVYAMGTVRSEERILLRNLGEPYALYCKRTPRFWPKFSLYHSPEFLEIRTKGLRIEFLRLLRWIWVPVALEILAQLRIQPWYPDLFPLP